MKRLLIAFAVFGIVCGYFNNAQADQIENMGAQMMLGSEGNPGMFCNVESVNVCVLAETEADCKKLEGKKVDSCPQPKSK